MGWEVIYQKYNDKYFLSYIKETGWNVDKKLGNHQETVSTKDHRFHVEIMINNIILAGFEEIKGKEPSSEELAKVGYDSTFWAGYTTLKNTPLNDKIILDLEREKSLRDQFDKDLKEP